MSSHKKSLSPNYFNTLYAKNFEFGKVEDRKYYDTSSLSDTESD